MPLGDSLASWHNDIVNLYKNAESLCTGGPWNPDDHSNLEVLIFGLCDECAGLREDGVEEVLGYFTYAFAQSCSELLEGKFPSYHHAIFSLASDVVADIRGRFEANPTDWTGLVDDLNRQAIEFERLAKVGHGILVQLNQELVVAIRLQSPGFQPAAKVASEALADHVESATSRATSGGLSHAIPPVAMGADAADAAERIKSEQLLPVAQARAKLIPHSDLNGNETAEAALPLERLIVQSSNATHQVLIPPVKQAADSSGDESETIPPEFRTRTMTMSEAARKLGYRGTNPPQHVNRLIKKGPSKGGIHPPIGSGQQWVFDIRNFPPAVQDSLRPKDV